MERIFNTAGPCDPEFHYMLPPERRLPEIRRLVEHGLYFVLHAPRQTGKTTLMRNVAESLGEEGRHVALYASCETGQAAGGDVERGVEAVLLGIDQEARRQLPPETRPPPLEEVAAVPAAGRLREYLSRWSESASRPVVLFLDEIDALLDDTLLSVLRQLRAGYSSRPRGFPHSLALIGPRPTAWGPRRPSTSRCGR